MSDDPAGVATRRAALDALRAIADGEGANSALDRELSRRDLDRRDRNLVTELVYGTTRMRRRCDAAVEPHLDRAPDPATRAALRLGAHQLLHLDVPAHAAVGATVGATPKRSRGFVNAVLRRVASSGPVEGRSLGERLSYPDWIVDRLVADLGTTVAEQALRQMNEPTATPVRDDGYLQGEASQQVVAAVAAQLSPNARVADLCAAPGGKSTGLARLGARVVAGDVDPSRVAVLATVADRFGGGRVRVVCTDGTAPPLRPRSVDAVLVDAPCTGLGVLGRRPDARWRLGPDALDRLSDLQRRLVTAGGTVVAPGGLLAYAVCTMTDAETGRVDRWLEETLPEWVAMPGPPPPWRPSGRGWLTTPSSANPNDGMYLLILRRP